MNRNIIGEAYDEETGVRVVFLRSSMPGYLKKIRQQLVDIAEAESIKLFRLARRMRKHGCSEKAISAVREEAYALHMTGYPERILQSECHDMWKYAFKF